MKKILLMLLFSFLSVQSITYSQSPTIQAILDETSIDSLVYFVRELSGDVETVIGGSPYTIQSRNKYEPGNDKAADYIEQKLASYGLTVFNQSFGSVGRNVYGVQAGTLYPDQIYIICAHYDDMPYGTIAPGADDNASGTAAVIEAARIFSQYSSEYTIIFALWDEEEQGLIGSSYYASQAVINGENILGVINMDMIAYDSDNDNVGEIHIRPIANSLNLKDQMVEVNTNYNLGVIPSIINPGTGASDQGSFWNNGFGALLLIEEYYGGDFNAYYHTINDLITHFNQPYYLKLSKLAFGTLATLAVVSGTVPVELVAFNAVQAGDRVDLEWSTATETNNLGFEIQRLVGNSNFKTIAFVGGAGTTTESTYYTYSDSPYLGNITSVSYRLKQIDHNGSYSYSKIISIEIGVPGEFVLEQNYPNPFNPNTKIAFTIPKGGFVTLAVYNIMGEMADVLINEQKPDGFYEVSFNGSDLPSGVYFYTLKLDNNTSTRKMILSK